MTQLGDRDPHHLKERGVVFPRALAEPFAERVAGVVDEYVQVDALLAQRIRDAARRGRVGEVGGERTRSHAARRLELGRELF